MAVLHTIGPIPVPAIRTYCNTIPGVGICESSSHAGTYAFSCSIVRIQCRVAFGGDYTVAFQIGEVAKRAQFYASSSVLEEREARTFAHSVSGVGKGV